MSKSTCENCKHLKLENMFGLVIAGCSLDGKIVPHTAELGKEIVFHRVPDTCQIQKGLKK